MRARHAAGRVALAAFAALGLAREAGAQLKISQVYSGGGITVAPLARDYVELHNPTGSSVAMTNWALQIATTTGTSWTVITLKSTVPAGRYFLVGLATATTVDAPALPAVDASGSPDLSTAGNKTALTNTNVALTGGQPTSAAIVDFVGLGTGADWREPFAGEGGGTADRRARTCRSTFTARWLHPECARTKPGVATWRARAERAPTSPAA